MREKHVTDQKAIVLLEKMLTLNPRDRISIEEVLSDPYLTGTEEPPCEKNELPRIQTVQEAQNKQANQQAKNPPVQQRGF